MSAITGRQSKFGLDVHNTFGTATACTKAFAVENYSIPLNVTRLVSSPIGRDESMYTTIDRGAIDPNVNFSMKVGYNNGFGELLATFFGTAAAPTEQTASQGDYLHVVKFNTTRLAYFLTLASQATNSELFELMDVWFSQLQLNFAGPFPNFVIADWQGGANQRIDNTGSVNTYAGLTALTAPTRDEIKARQLDFFRINSDSGAALGVGDIKAVTGVQVIYSDPLETITEMKGQSYNSRPGNTDLFTGQVVVNFRALDDFTYFTAGGAGTTYKADVYVEGNQIGSGVKQRFNPAFPLLKVVDDPQFTYANPGRNEFVVTFDMLVRSAAPTGMADKYPHINIVNNLSTSLLA